MIGIPGDARVLVGTESGLVAASRAINQAIPEPRWMMLSGEVLTSLFNGDQSEARATAFASPYMTCFPCGGYMWYRRYEVGDRSEWVP